MKFITLKNKMKKSIDKVFPNSKIVSINKFHKGFVNKTYFVKLSNPENMIVIRFYREEAWKAKKEAYIYNLITNKTNVPVPKVFLTDTSKKIFNENYNILEYSKGIDLGKALSRRFDKAVAYQAGAILAKIHSIHFKKYGWIIGNKINPSFSRWKDFIKYDLNIKFSKLKKTAMLDKTKAQNIKNFINKNLKLVNINPDPCLIHKDYHFSHILVNNGIITGIIDAEWALSGHTELDFVKVKWFMFKRFPQMETPFLAGYKHSGGILPKNKERMMFYEFITLMGMINFAHEMGNKKFLDYYNKELCNLLRR